MNAKLITANIVTPSALTIPLLRAQQGAGPLDPTPDPADGVYGTLEEVYAHAFWGQSYHANILLSALGARSVRRSFSSSPRAAEMIRHTALRPRIFDSLLRCHRIEGGLTFDGVNMI